MVTPYDSVTRRIHKAHIRATECSAVSEVFRRVALGPNPRHSLDAVATAAVGAVLLFAATAFFYDWAVAHRTFLLGAVLVGAGIDATYSVRRGGGLLAALTVVVLLATAVSLRTLGGVSAMTPVHVLIWTAVENVLLVSILVGTVAYLIGRTLHVQSDTHRSAYPNTFSRATCSFRNAGIVTSANRISTPPARAKALVKP